MAGGETESVGLEATPTYAVAIVAFAFILVSLLVERLIHRLRKYLKKKNQKPLRKCLDKMTEELMLLGFISLLLTVFQNRLVKICATPNFSKHLLPCSASHYEEVARSPESAFAPATEASIVGRRLLQLYFEIAHVDVGPRRQLLAGDSGASHCAAEGKVQFVSLEVLHQLHLFIFTLAVTHVFYSLLTVCLGFLRLNHWDKWEKETQVEGYQGPQDLEHKICDKLRCQKPHLQGLDKGTHAFIDRHANHVFYEHRISLWILCFFHQFFSSVSREDYLTFRVGFLKNHNLGERFNFRDYVVRSMEVDFKKVLGISWWLWLVVVGFLLLNVHDWYTYFWAAFIPAIIILIIGTKQQHIISTLALQAKRHAEAILAAEAGSQKAYDNANKKLVGMADISKAVVPRDSLFWFDDPKHLLTLIHFVIFQNSFELAVFFWLLTTFGWHSCILGNHKLFIIRLFIGMFSQLLASYCTLPIYALVTQMGSKMKKTVLRKDVFDGLQKWRKTAVAKAEKRRSAQASPDDTSVSVEGLSTQGFRDEDTVPQPVMTSLPSLSREASIPEHAPIDKEFYRSCQLRFGKNASDIIMAAKADQEDE